MIIGFLLFWAALRTHQLFLIWKNKQQLYTIHCQNSLRRNAYIFPTFSSICDFTADFSKRSFSNSDVSLSIICQCNNEHKSTDANKREQCAVCSRPPFAQKESTGFRHHWQVTSHICKMVAIKWKILRYPWHNKQRKGDWSG